MPIDVDAAERFVLANARLLERHRLAILLHGAPVAPLLDALRAYRNPDGGFGHALEPDIRTSESELAATRQALEVLIAVGALDDQMTSDASAWIGTIALPDGGVPFVVPPESVRAPWIKPSEGGSFLTFGVTAAMLRAGSDEPWLGRATEWCWSRVERPDELDAYGVKSALELLDAVPDEDRARAAIEGIRPRLRPDGSIPVRGGTEDEQLTALTLSERPGERSRALFTDDQIEADLERLEQGQEEDGGWTFDWLAWSPGQYAEGRGMVTVRAVETLHAHDRVQL